MRAAHVWSLGNVNVYSWLPRMAVDEQISITRHRVKNLDNMYEAILCVGGFGLNRLDTGKREVALSRVGARRQAFYQVQVVGSASTWACLHNRIVRSSATRLPRGLLITP